MHNSQDQSLALPGLIGETCEQIWFVRDYVMVILGGHSITCVTDPEVETARATYRLPEAGSRDALCALIGATIQHATQQQTGTVEFEFSEGLILRVSPWPDDPSREFVYIQERNW